MSRNGDHDDLRDVEQRLIGARLELSAIEQDELRRRVAHRLATQAPAGTRMRRARRRGLATLLVSGAVLSSGASVVLATGTTSTQPSTTHPPDSAGCQYHQSFTKTFTFPSSQGTLTIKIVYDCKTNTYTITITCTKVITYCNGKKLPAGTKTTTITVTPSTKSVTLVINGQTIVVPLLLAP